MVIKVAENRVHGDSNAIVWIRLTVKCSLGALHHGCSRLGFKRRDCTSGSLFKAYRIWRALIMTGIGRNVIPGMLSIIDVRAVTYHQVEWLSFH